ncbi:Coiled-coil domain-containing protein 93 [Tritrichomonas musculus]|uniref:Coiled-coil domain-containing protein 93 n=1 Tax=Tritrichomonas musculus TaxID=1915356 RepID=A0ABR2KJN6_9EUKA
MSQNTQEDNVSRAREEVIRLLLSAGYFRVRMPDIDDFDKVAGGLAWALKSSSVDVDVDIFFKERPNIGEKIRISESICSGLQKSKCPFPLAPYQIQGLDFPKLFPIIQWLVKLVIATRNEFGDFQRSYAEFSFNNKYANLPSDVLIQEHSYASRSNIREVERFYPPKRIYKRSDWDSSKSELKQIETTLLEYGRVPVLITAQSKPVPQAVSAQAAAAAASSGVSAGAAPKANPNSAFAKATALVGSKLGATAAAPAAGPASAKASASASVPSAAKRQEGPTEEELKEIEENHNIEMKNTIKSMIRTEGGDESITFNAFSDLVNDEEIIRQKTIKEQEIRNAVPESKITASQLRVPHEEKMAVIREQIDNMKTEFSKIKEKYQEVHSKYEDVSGRHTESTANNKKLKKQIKQCNEIIEESQHTDDLLRAISVRDDTVRNIELFKEQCQQEIKEWKEKIENLKANANNDDSENDAVIHQTLDNLERDSERIKTQLADKARTLLELETDADQVPSNAELTQYDRRLNELGMLAKQKAQEAKKCEQLLNGLVSSQEVLQNENDMFNTILKDFKEAEKDSKKQKALIEQLTTTSKETTAKKQKVLQQLKEKKDLMAKKDERYRKLLEDQRKYFQTIKEFQLACDELETLKGEE